MSQTENKQKEKVKQVKDDVLSNIKNSNYNKLRGLVIFYFVGGQIQYI